VTVLKINKGEQLVNEDLAKNNCTVFRPLTLLASTRTRAACGRCFSPEPMRRALLTVVLIGLCTAVNAAEPPAKLALEGGRIVPVVGKEIAKGTVLIENGKITAIGEDVEVPYDAMAVDVSGKVVFPGMIAPHSSEGLDRANENLSVTPYLDVYDAIDPSSLFFEDALREGALGVHVIQGNSCVIGALSRLVRPIGRTPDEMTIRPAVALKLSTSPKTDRMTQMATLRETFLELEEYLENLAEQRYEAKLKEEDKEIDVPPEEARKLGRELIRDEHCDDKHRNLRILTQGRQDAWIYCGYATDVAPAVRIAKENGFLERTVFVLGTEAYRAADELKEAGRPVVLSSELVHQERDPITGELQETFVPKVIHDAKIQFALQPDENASLAERYLTYQAARCVRHGIPRQVALEAITMNPARMLGVDDRLGSLEVGKAAYIVVFSGDPLDFNSWVEKCYIDGILAYDRTKDVRLKELLGLEEKQAEKAKAEAEKEEEKDKEPAEDEEQEEEKPAEDASAEKREKEADTKKNGEEEPEEEEDEEEEDENDDHQDGAPADEPEQRPAGEER
jgi:imidazolonepropionase-like amidohydrolase